ncbi:S-adenosylmethionine mitochondrial carrier protein-like [Centruroides sculpturatus]|uniref:S-adenosylmethionine mitochondrial carrier protein-like n=1 Tax=Centruroides sculpturatus TaxID=218467 RepID=UPI000C6D5FF7|nr:S-adenosylmethionine mitochondrial carrier protein-like [Centruroides sculpturatus]
MSVAKSDFLTALISGGAAGTSVDIILYPLDTIKTRLQSAEGFWKSGGIRGIYSGLSSVALGSAPGAAAFFCTYEFVKKVSNPLFSDAFQPISHMVASSCGEVMACIIRVPVEVIKQRAQANPCNSSFQIFKKTLISEYAAAFFCTYEFVKKVSNPLFSDAFQPISHMVASSCGEVMACIIRVPVEVIKQRAQANPCNSSFQIFKKTLISELIIIIIIIIIHLCLFSRLYAGLIPRVLWMSLGGAIFLGVYEKSNQLIIKFVYKD